MRFLIDTVLYSPSFLKALILSLVVLVGSSIRAALHPSVPFFADKDNLVNTYYVKWSWAWTLLPLVPTVSVTSFLYTKNLVRNITHLSRVALSHMTWYFATSLFAWFRSSTPSCSNPKFHNESSCVSSGHIWDGIDISGHIFLLLYCTLVLTEEFQSIFFHIWKLYGDIIQKYSSALSQSKLALSLKIYNSKAVNSMIRLLELIAATEIVLNVIMMTSTSLFFHTFLENSLALFISLFAWYTTYHLLYKYLQIGPRNGLLNPLSKSNMV